MTERKPREVPFETWVERQIRTAQERGDFDDLPGAGKPLPGAGKPVEELWWVKGYLEREGLSGEELLPPPLQLRKEVERLPARVPELPDEQAVRSTVAELNRRIVAWLRNPVGPRVPITTVSAEEMVELWRQARLGHDPPVRPAPATAAAPPRSRWARFKRLLRGR